MKDNTFTFKMSRRTTFFATFVFLQVAFTCINSKLYAQNQDFDSLTCVSKYAEKQDSFLSITTIPDEYRLAVTVAFSGYKSIDIAKIKFKKSKIKTTLNARPTVFSFFRKKSKRFYIIRINDSEKGEILLNEVPFTAQVGIFAHEFSHLKDYSERNFFGLIARTADYSCTRSRKAFEYEIDSLTVEHGYGVPLQVWADYAMNKSSASEKYKSFKRKIYRSPQDIARLTQLYNLREIERRKQNRN